MYPFSWFNESINDSVGNRPNTNRSFVDLRSSFNLFLKAWVVVCGKNLSFVTHFVPTPRTQLNAFRSFTDVIRYYD